LKIENWKQNNRTNEPAGGRQAIEIIRNIILFQVAGKPATCNL